MVQDPIAGLALALQRGAAAKAVLLPPASQSAVAMAFDLEVVVDGILPDGQPRLLGPCVQGPPTARFVYLCVGAYAGQTDAQWSGRVKVPLGDLGGLDGDTMAKAAAGGRLVAHIAGRGPKGGPALASVKLLPPGWVLAG